MARGRKKKVEENIFFSKEEDQLADKHIIKVAEEYSLQFMVGAEPYYENGQWKIAVKSKKNDMPDVWRSYPVVIR